MNLNQQPREKIAEDVESRLNISKLILEIKSITEKKFPNCSPFSLHLDPQADLLSYSDVQIISYLCHATSVTLSLSIGGCEANRDLQELASLNVGSIQVSCTESAFALKKLVLSYKKIYDVLQVPIQPGITLLVNTPGSFSCMSDILESPDIEFVSSFMIDRNALTKYSINDSLIQSIASDAKIKLPKNKKVRFGICGGITPMNIYQLANYFRVDYISTKMFAADSSLFTDDSEYASDLLGSFLVLEARILELILKCRESVSFLIRQRKNNLIDYTQASAVHRLLNN